MDDSIETVVIGAGHAGLSTSYHLKQQGYEHIVIDKASHPGNAWRSERWDSFTFVSPNWAFQVPGAEYDGPDPDGFMTRAELVDRFARYARSTSFRLSTIHWLLPSSRSTVRASWFRRTKKLFMPAM